LGECGENGLIGECGENGLIGECGENGLIIEIMQANPLYINII